MHVRTDAPRVPRHDFSLRLPPLDVGDHEIVFDIKVERRATDEDHWKALSEREITLPVTVSRSTLAESMLPVRSDAMDTAIGSAITRLTQWQGIRLPVRVQLRPDRTYTSAFADTIVALRIDVMRNGEVARQLETWWLAGPNVGDRKHAWEVPMWDDARLGALSTPEDEWSLRIRGAPDLALHIEGATQYWSGEMIVPVPVLLRSGRPPSRGWMAGDEPSSRGP